MQIQNSELIKEIQNASKVQTMQGLPSNLSGLIVPVIEVNPKLTKAVLVSNVSSGTTGSLSVLTADPNRDVYIKSVCFSITKDVTCDLATNSYGVACTIGGAGKNLIGVSCITLTAQSASYSVSFPTPIKIDRNSSVSISGTFTAGVCWRYGSITYYLDETSNGS